MIPISKIIRLALFTDRVGRCCFCSRSFPLRWRWSWGRSISNVQRRVCECWSRGLPCRSSSHRSRADEGRRLLVCSLCFSRFGLATRNSFGCSIHLQTQIFTLSFLSFALLKVVVTVLPLFTVRFACFWCVFLCCCERDLWKGRCVDWGQFVGKKMKKADQCLKVSYSGHNLMKKVGCWWRRCAAGH